MTEDQGQRNFLRRVLGQAATRFGAEITGRPVFGWNDRTIGAQVMLHGHAQWIRATGERERDTHDEFWTGNRDAALLTGIPKPDVTQSTVWHEDGVVILAEMMTYVADRPVSATPELREGFSGSDAWWVSLRRATDVLARQPTRRGRESPAWFQPTLRVFFGGRADRLEPSWATEHMDLHWANVTVPELYILDWEFWGRAPAGYGAAMLYCHSLLVPSAAQRVQRVFADILDTEHGAYAQLCVIGHLLRRIDNGDPPNSPSPCISMRMCFLPDGGADVHQEGPGWERCARGMAVHVAASAAVAAGRAGIQRADNISGGRERVWKVYPH